MMILKTLLVGCFLSAFSLGFYRVAVKVSCVQQFQAVAFSRLTGELNTAKGVFKGLQMVCGELLLTKKVGKFVEVSNPLGSRTLKLNMEGNVVNQSIASP